MTSKLFLTIWTGIAIAVVSFACGPDLTNIERAKPGETWDVKGTWGPPDNEDLSIHGFPVLIEPIRDIKHYEVARQFTQEGNLQEYIETLGPQDYIHIYVIRRHVEYDGWLRVEVNQRSTSYINGWIHSSWVRSAEKVTVDPTTSYEPTLEQLCMVEWITTEDFARRSSSLNACVNFRTSWGDDTSYCYEGFERHQANFVENCLRERTQ